jgi:flavin-dependent dehydrogenase
MIVGDPGGPFNVVGSHTYAQAGVYAARVTINELDGSGNSASANTTADVISFAIELLQPPPTGRAS